MFEQLIAQAFASSGTNLIGEIALLIGAVGGFITGIAGFMKAGKAKDIAVAGGQAATFASQKTVEYADRIKNILQAGYNLSPEEAKKAADSVVDDMDKLSEQVKYGTEQFKIVIQNVPLEARADSIRELPREKFDTKPDPLQ